jgi:hypothetical protein
MKTFLKFGIILLILPLLFTACKKDESMLIGKWECTYLDEYYYDFWEEEYVLLKGTPAELGLSMTLEFIDEQTCYRTTVANGYSNLQQFSYTYHDNLLSVNSITYTVSVTNNSLYLEVIMGDEYEKLTFKKME